MRDEIRSQQGGAKEGHKPLLQLAPEVAPDHVGLGRMSVQGLGLEQHVLGSGGLARVGGLKVLNIFVQSLSQFIHEAVQRVQLRAVLFEGGAFRRLTDPGAHFERQGGCPMRERSYALAKESHGWSKAIGWTVFYGGSLTACKR
jgi:hypothetical protein